ncbi:DinB family protein [Ammoniphilus resinae]|uniref:Damage-inducible protein DinB n=1 Tax=Ammoniphilus resinae TaxID=861532 RepID=A0ABS4GKS9_9BACL|nr:putative damage-inducible protein DinB [Ammoniphilus resinae]
MENDVMQLFEYHVWANRLVFEHLRKLPEDVWDKELTTVFPSVCSLMSHIYSMDLMWLGVLQERPFHEVRALLMQLLEETKTESLENMEKRFEKAAKEYQDFLSECHPEKILTLAHPQYGSVNTPLSGVIQHVVNHGTYHRGNLTAMLRQSGHPGVATDYAFYMFTM